MIAEARWTMTVLALATGAAIGQEASSGPGNAAFVQPCLDYGRSFVNTKAVFNSPRFWVESRCRIADPLAEEVAEYLQCGSCKSENTFAESDLFMAENYDFLPIFGTHECVVFRRRAQCAEDYCSVYPLEKMWDGTTPCLRTFRGRVLKTPDEIKAAMEAGMPILGQTEIRDEATGRAAILEYPVKTLNWGRDRAQWQVDTGPVLLPDLTAPPEEWSARLRLAFIAFNTWDWADFVVEQPTAAKGEGDQSAQVYHYSGSVHLSARNVLLAQDIAPSTASP